MKKILLIITILFGIVSFAIATDYDDEPVNSWNDDGYQLMSDVNGILKIMKFTNASSHVNQGDYKITFEDPMGEEHTTTTAVLNVTQTDASSPMIIKFAIKEDMSVNTRRYVYIKVNQSVSSNYPLGDFELTTYALDNNLSVANWNSSVGPYDRARLVISANSSGQSVVQMEATNKDGAQVNTIWMNLLVDDKDFTSGVASMSDVNISFNANHIIDTNGTNNVLSSRTQLDTTYYQYKLFNIDGSKITLGSNVISSFPFETNSGAWGFVGANYDNNDTNDTGGTSGIVWSGKYYADDNIIDINDTITSSDGIDYDISDINKTHNLIMLKLNGSKQDVAPWEDVNISGPIYYKSGDILYPPSSENNGEWSVDANLTDGNTYQIPNGGTSYKVKAIMIVKSKHTMDTNATLTGLVSDNNGSISGLNELKTRLENNTLSNPGLTFNTSDVEDVKTWFDALNYDLVEMKVINGVDK